VADPSIVTLCSATLGEDGTREPPLGPLYIAAALEQTGVTVDFRDLQLDPIAHGLSGDSLVRLLSGHADVVAISCFVDMLPAVIDATRRLHEERPDTLFVLGGPGPTAAARRLLERHPWIHAVVRGEGEETVQDWIRMLRDGSDAPVPGMVRRSGRELVDGPARPRNRQLDELPPPAYHLLDWDRYTDARVITTRGCSYRCSFCDVTALWGHRSVYRDVAATVAEMEMLAAVQGHRSVSIVDDTFVLNRDRVRALCRLLVDRRSGISWGCFGRINLMSPDLVQQMAEAGCRSIFYGIDSGSQRVLDRTVKRLDASDILPVLRLSAQHFEKIEASFIWGYPFESLDDFRRTLDVAGEASLLSPTVNVQVHMLSPLPLSPMYQEFTGRLLEPDPADARWLLLPALLLNERAAVVREIVRSAPDIHPGFFTFPTPEKHAKRELLERAFRALERTIGRTVLDARIATLLERQDTAVEAELLTRELHPADRIGVGLALGFLQRTRRKDARTRGPSMVRERVETARRNA
jgi:radical SAM superfamily enzyme YgiQ (UPF0313 family)